MPTDFDHRLSRIENEVGEEIHHTTRATLTTLLNSVSTDVGDRIVEFVQHKYEQEGEYPTIKDVKDYANNQLDVPSEQLPRYNA
ncbi:MAG: hypothetical protein ABEI52_08230 [Halobacteriaceae archaeon]